MFKDLIVTLNNTNTQDLALLTANKLFSMQDFRIKKDFLSLVESKFLAEVEQLDFSNPKESAETINKWVEVKTQEKIKNLVAEEAINDHTRLILVNAIYFKANWKNKFKKINTFQEDFHLGDGQIVKCDMMHLRQENLIYKHDPCELGFSTCELPYHGENVSMTIILPHDGVELKDIEMKLDGDVIRKVLTEKGSLVSVNLHLPKFKIEHKLEVLRNFDSN
jgi:serpin B